MRRHILAGAAIVAAVFGVYSNSLRNGFVWDDHLYIEANPFLKDPANIRRLLDPGSSTSSPWIMAGHRPVFLASLLLDRAVWGFHPAGYHLTNLLLHCADSLWVYGLGLVIVGSWPAALLAGLAFGLHPIQTEAVDGICFRPDLLAAFFVFASLWAYLKARGAAGRKAPFFLAASAALFGLGLLSKEMAASLPLLVILVEVFFPAQRGRRARLAWTLAGFALVAAAYTFFWSPRFDYAGLKGGSAPRPAMAGRTAAVTAPAEAGTARVPEPRQSRFFSRRSAESRKLYLDRRAWFWTMSVAFSEYFRLLIFPEPLVVDRSPGLFPVCSDRVLGSLAFLSLLLVYAAVLRKGHPASAFGIAWCFAALAPVSGILPLYNPIAERYLYMVAAGAAWAMASVAALAFTEPAEPGARPSWAMPVASVLAVAVLAGYAVRTRLRNRDWASDRALFLAVPLADQTSRASFIRGNILRHEGRLALAGREYEQALRSDPGFAEVWLNLGMTHAAAGKNAEAAACYEMAVALMPGNPVFHFGRAVFLDSVKNVKAAAKSYQAALELDPGYVQAWVNLGSLYRDSGKIKEAKACYEKAVALSPADPVPYYSYGLLLETSGQAARAEASFREALSRDEAFEPAKRRLEAMLSRSKKLKR